jgi:transposase
MPVQVLTNTNFGDVIACDTVFLALGLGKSFAEHTHKRNGFDLPSVCRVITNNYCVDRTSARDIPGWYAQQQALRERIGLAPAELLEAHIYRALDYLDEEAQKAIANDWLATLVARYDVDLSLLLGDTTSTYFEGQACQLAKHGYSRDHRPDCPQVNIEITVTHPDGFPVRQAVFAGNIPDQSYGQTLIDGVYSALAPFQQKATLALDRGLSRLAHRRRVLQHHWDYVAGLELEGDVRQAVLALPESGFVPADLTDPDLQVAILEAKVDDIPVRQYVYRSQTKAQEAEQERRRRLAQVPAAIATLQEKVDQGQYVQTAVIARRAKSILKELKVNLYYTVRVGKDKRIHLTLKEEVLAERRQLDGIFVLETSNLHLSAQQALTTYRQRDGVDGAVRVLKELIEVRPIRYWNPQRVKAHVFLCLVAYLILMVVQHVLRKMGVTKRLDKVLRALHEIRLVVTRVCLADLEELDYQLTGLSVETRTWLTALGVDLLSLPAG